VANLITPIGSSRHSLQENRHACPTIDVPISAARDCPWCVPHLGKLQRRCGHGNGVLRSRCRLGSGMVEGLHRRSRYLLRRPLRRHRGQAVVKAEGDDTHAIGQLSRTTK
jgi:hypothetical protein